MLCCDFLIKGKLGRALRRLNYLAANEKVGEWEVKS
jgi:hypothetical protein